MLGRKSTQMSIIFTIFIESPTKIERNCTYMKLRQFPYIYIHDCLPYNYAEQGIWAGDASLCKYYIFFSPFDPLLIVH